MVCGEAEEDTGCMIQDKRCVLRPFDKLRANGLKNEILKQVQDDKKSRASSLSMGEGAFFLRTA